MELVGVVQNYAWGKLGPSSAVAELSSKEEVEGDRPYAELWMGTHPNGPAYFKGSGETLKEYIQCCEDKESLLGKDSLSHFGCSGGLPFLLKILSVRKALSIQAHPDKTLAEALHAQRPDIYKDPNHKPEMALALTEFEGLCGFRPLKEISKFLDDVGPLRTVVGEDNAAALKEEKPGALKNAFGALMQCDAEVIKAQLEVMNSPNYAIPHLKDLFNRLSEEYPGDVGCFVIYFLNYVVLQPGESMFLGPNLPHAYLRGDCVECMACSDNVVRAGLTPKLIDVPTLLSMLEYKPTEEVTFCGEKEDESSVLFNPPVKDFALVKIHVPTGKGYSTLPRASASILIYTEGPEDVKGKIFFLKAGETLYNPSRTSDVLAFQAFCSC